MSLAPHLATSTCPAVTQNTPPRRRSRSFALGAGMALVALSACTLLTYLQHFQLPAPTGPYAVGTVTFDLTDLGRPDPFSADPKVRRELVVQLWYPAKPSHRPVAPYLRWREARFVTLYKPLLNTHSRSGAPPARSGSPFPVLLFSHRWDGQRTQNTVLAEDLASHGYVVASIDRPHNASRTELADGTVIRGHEVLEGPKGAAASVEERIAFWNQTLQLWAADERFVLDRLAIRSATPGDPFQDLLDTAHAGAFGHSFGGASSLALCGADPRIEAAVNLDGWTFGALRDRTAAQQILLFYEGFSQHRERELSILPVPGSSEDQLDRADFAATEDSLRRFGGYRLFLAGTQHMDFSDEPLLPPFRRLAYTGPTAPADVNRILRQTVLQFFDHALRSKPAPLLTSSQMRFPDLAVQHWPGTRSSGFPANQ